MIQNLERIAKTLIFSSVILIIVSILFTPFEVNGRSMQPTLHDGDKVLVLKLNYLKIPFTDRKLIIKMPKRNSIIAFTKPNQDTQLVKRVIALPTEEVDIRNRIVYINNEWQERGFGVTNPNSDFPIIIEENCTFVLGDNRNLSTDSREFGCVPVENINGQIALRIWPINKLTLFR